MVIHSQVHDAAPDESRNTMCGRALIAFGDDKVLPLSEFSTFNVHSLKCRECEDITS